MPSAAAPMGARPLLLVGPCGLDGAEECLHLFADRRFTEVLGRNHLPTLAEVRAGLAEMWGDPEKSKEARGGVQGPSGVTGVCSSCSGDLLENCQEPL